MILSQDFDYDEEDAYFINYEAKKNIFYLDGGFINYNIFAIMTPNEVAWFKRVKEDVVVRTKDGDTYIIYYDDGDYDE
jgi:hypothetical protein